MANETRRLVTSWISQTARGAAWAPILVFLLHVLFSRVLGTYLAFPPVDIPMHLAGGVAIAYFVSYAARTAFGLGLLGHPNRILLVVTVFTAACTAAVFWEFAEFCSDALFGTRAQIDLPDTVLDMFLGVVGAVAYLFIVRFRVCES